MWGINREIKSSVQKTLSLVAFESLIIRFVSTCSLRYILKGIQRQLGAFLAYQENARSGSLKKNTFIFAKYFVVGILGSFAKRILL